MDAAAALARARLVIPGALVCIESGEEAIDISDKRLSGYELLKSTRYGKMTAVNILIYRGESEE